MTQSISLKKILIKLKYGLKRLNKNLLRIVYFFRYLKNIGNF